ncbi:anthranilate synthase component II [Hugonella massiliensis]|uniref:anthranilate synthase component II n=1 Tax=Hugonella massiliensis TaxID=1720315 RepID=UPI00073F774A|nr:aminodeoxychorismate/anthranilate synthase component II [Hugonella massiliensis]
MILLIDNYDSFSYNLYQLIGSIEPDVRVVRNDELSVDAIAALDPAGIVLSPGSHRPEDAGVCIEAVRELSGTVPLLGVCLGHQAICAAFGATVGYAKGLMHGKQSVVTLDARNALFAGCPSQTPVARYHSLAVDESTLPACLAVTARADDGEVMAVSHVEHPTFGVQFHPESIMTPEGGRMLTNFIGLARAR